MERKNAALRDAEPNAKAKFDHLAQRNKILDDQNAIRKYLKKAKIIQ